MSVSRLTHIASIGVEHVGALADRLNHSEVLRLENLDTDLRPPSSALECTRRAIDDDDANSYLPLFDLDVLRQAAAHLVAEPSGQHYDWRSECIITTGLGKIAATPMLRWRGVPSAKCVRLVFSNKPVHRLSRVGKRVRQALT